MSSNTLLIDKQINELVFGNPRITLSELSSSLDIDRRKIEEALKKRYGHGFRVLKNKVRLKYIIELLAKDNPRKPIKEIASDIGMHPNNLSRFIRLMTGCCARKLRYKKVAIISPEPNQIIR